MVPETGCLVLKVSQTNLFSCLKENATLPSKSSMGPDSNNNKKKNDKIPKVYSV